MNYGMTEDLSNFDIIRYRIYNSLLLVVILLQLVIFFTDIFQFDLRGLKIVTFHIFFIVGLLVINKYGYINKSILIFTIIYPILIFVLIFLYAQPNFIDYTFIVFFILSFLLNKGLLKRLLIGSMPILFLIYSKSGHYLIGYGGYELDKISDWTLLIASILVIFIILLSLLRELRLYEGKTRKLFIELENKNEELLGKNKELERFSYVVSHDMKTPLRAVAGYINILERRLKNESQENLRYFQYIKENATQLNNLVVETLEFSKIDNNKVELEPIDVNEILFKLSRDFITKDIQVYTDSFPKVLGNKVLVNKIFQNLIENGGKYNDSEEKMIEITSVTKGNKVIFAIKDNGIGIDERYHCQIFEMYKRLHTKQEYVGTGLGLSICKKIALQLNGDIYLTSKLGKGSTFYLELELAR